VEFFDYNCPYCRRVAPTVVELEEADPGLRVVYKEFPILGPNSIFSAKAALAVHRQGKHAAFHKELMMERGVADEAKVLRIADKIGVDVDRMKSDMNDPAIEAAIERNLALAQALRINGTPSFVIGEQTLRGATDLKALQSLIRQARDTQ
jgi:protein-disulfide isomerase